MTDFTLYGMPGSLYTGKARAYLRKQRVAFEEYPAGGPRYGEHVLPHIGRWIIPVLQAPDGTLVQDTEDIFAFVAAAGLEIQPAVPADPLLETVARIFDLYGGEGMLRPAMHYRWNFDAENLAFLRHDFASALSPGASAEDADMRFAFAQDRMRAAAASFGVIPAAIASIEASYAEFLALFDAHLAHAPYLLGGAPTLGDYGLIGPLYAHLGRDPFPASLMKRQAPRVWRWVERMNAPEGGAGEYGDIGPDLFNPTHLPATLLALLRFVAEDYLPEIEAIVGGANAWLAARAHVPVSDLMGAKPAQRAFGQVTFLWRGVEIPALLMPYRILMLQNVQDAAGHAPGAEALLNEVGLGGMLTRRVVRRVVRSGHLEVWER